MLEHLFYCCVVRFRIQISLNSISCFWLEFRKEKEQQTQPKPSPNHPSTQPSQPRSIPAPRPNPAGPAHSSFPSPRGLPRTAHRRSPAPRAQHCVRAPPLAASTAPHVSLHPPAPVFRPRPPRAAARPAPPVSCFPSATRRRNGQAANLAEISAAPPFPGTHAKAAAAL